ncbi:unnamed protein product, partial [Phaeothamnion confervicola]
TNSSNGGGGGGGGWCSGSCSECAMSTTAAASEGAAALHAGSTAAPSVLRQSWRFLSSGPGMHSTLSKAATPPASAGASERDEGRVSAGEQRWPPWSPEPGSSRIGRPSPRGATNTVAAEVATAAATALKAMDGEPRPHRPQPLPLAECRSSPSSLSQRPRQQLCSQPSSKQAPPQSPPPSPPQSTLRPTADNAA